MKIKTQVEIEKDIFERVSHYKYFGPSKMKPPTQEEVDFYDKCMQERERVIEDTQKRERLLRREQLIFLL